MSRRLLNRGKQMLQYVDVPMKRGKIRSGRLKSLNLIKKRPPVVVARYENSGAKKKTFPRQK